MSVSRFKPVIVVWSLLMVTSIALAEVHVRQLSGDVAPLTSPDGRVSGVSFTPTTGPSPLAPPANLYDAIPISAGGTAVPPSVGSLPGFDWVGTAAGWGDDLHGAAGVINTLYYGFINTGSAVATHTVFVANNPGGTAAEPTAVTVGMSPLATIPLGAIGAPGAFIVSITGLSIPNGTAGNTWVHLLDSGAGEPTNFWLTGPTGAIGFSHDVGAYGFGPASTYPLSGPAIGLPTVFNTVLGLNMIPEPAAISLMGIAGLAVLRRRRR